MSAPKNCVDVLVLSASLRSQSLNGRLASLALDAVQRHDGTGTLALMSEFDCPSFDQDDEAESGVPEAAKRFCDRLQATDAIIISSPEYNASMPGALKNLIDWTSRVRPQPFNGKQALLLSASPSMAGGNRGLWALRVPLEHLGMRVYPDMFSLAQAHQAFGVEGRIANETLQKRFDQVVNCFMDLVEAAKHYPALKKQWVEFLGEHPDHATDRVEVAETAAV